MKSFFNILLIVFVLSSFFNCKKNVSNKTESDNKWKFLFNGENLDDWIVKINGYELHDNHLNTFMNRWSRITHFHNMGWSPPKE